MPSLLRAARRLLALAAASLAACKGTEPPTPTTLVISPSFATLSSLGDTLHLAAQVRDQRGDSMPGVTVTWSSSASLVATVSGTGLVTAVSNGSAEVTATAGNARASIPVNVVQVAAQVVKTGGDEQSGTVGQALSLQLRVRVNDSRGNAVANAPVTWAVVSGGGSISGSNADANGAASATWTLGTATGSGQASATSGSASATFAATQSTGPASAISIVAGNNQQATVNTVVTIRPRVRVTDQFGNLTSSITVNWTVTGGGGSVTPSSSVTDANGEATVTSWTMGSSGGANTLSAAIFGGGATVTFTATATVAGAPAAIAALVGDGQTGLAGYSLNVRPAARVTDNTGQPVANVQVTFAVASGGGSAMGASAITTASGIAQVGSWQVQSGVNTLTATATGSGISGNPVTFTATGASPTFNIDVRNVGRAFLPVEQAAFDAAAARWQQVVYQDLPDVPVSVPAGQCGSASPAVNETVDDVIIFASVVPIDGPGGVLGSAGPCFVRSSNASTLIGLILFDSADVAMLAADGRLSDVILHEMGHVIGIGTVWNVSLQSGFTRTCRQNTAPTPADGSVDTYYNCPSGLSAFDSIGGTGYTGGNKVPVENTGGSGTANGHWRESTFDDELMTGFIEAAGIPDPMSLLTVGSLEDLGYTVNYAARGNYSHVFMTRAVVSGRTGADLDLGDDIYHGPIYVLDGAGRIVRVITPR